MHAILHHEMSKRTIRMTILLCGNGFVSIYKTQTNQYTLTSNQMIATRPALVHFQAHKQRSVQKFYVILGYVVTYSWHVPFSRSSPFCFMSCLSTEHTATLSIYSCISCEIVYSVRTFQNWTLQSFQCTTQRCVRLNELTDERKEHVCSALALPMFVSWTVLHLIFVSESWLGVRRHFLKESYRNASPKYRRLNLNMNHLVIIIMDRKRRNRIN